MSILKFIPKKVNKFKNAVNIFSDYALTQYAATRNLCIKIRRDDNSELDIGFDGKRRNDAAILAFVGVGGNAWICVRYSQISSALDCVISIAADQQQICNAGAIVALTTKYNCFEPANSSLSLNDAAGLLAVNGRMNNLSAASYVVFKDSRTTNLTGYSTDYMAPLKFSANGFDDFSNNGTGMFWYFRDGVTSILARPAITCVPGGTDYMFCTNMQASGILFRVENSTGCLLNTKDLPNVTYGIDIGNPGINGKAENAPKPIFYMFFWGANITGVYTPNPLVPSLFLNYNASASDTDQTLITCAAVITKLNGTLRYKNNRTFASDDAVAILVAKGWNLIPT